MPTLFDKVYGCIAGSNCGAAFAYPTEGMSYEQIVTRFGKMEDFQRVVQKERIKKKPWGPHWHTKSMQRIPGMTEDGIERQRLVSTAIIEKGGRVTIDDVARIWVRDITPDKFGYLLGNQDQIIYYLFKAGFPPPDVGRYVPWPGLIGTSKMVHPIGIVNACNPQAAALDAFDVTRLRDTRYRPKNFSIEVAGAIAAATAEAMKPAATVDSIIDTALSILSEEPRQEVEDNLKVASGYKDVFELRVPFYQKYVGRNGSNAVEAVSEALALFLVTKGDVEMSIMGAANFGRDTECIACTVGGIAGALRGIAAVPKVWVETVEAALRQDKYTVSNRSLKETAEGLYQVLKNNLAKIKEQLNMCEEQMEG